VDNFPYNAPQFIVNLVYVLGLGSLISLLTFMGLGLVYRKKLDQRREECRQRVATLLESRLGKPATTSWRDDPVSDASLGTARVAAGGNGSPIKIESAAQG
jgi:hypothetical protein